MNGVTSIGPLVRKRPQEVIVWLVVAIVEGLLLLMRAGARTPYSIPFGNQAQWPATFQSSTAISCIDPSPDLVAGCDAMAQQILDSTVRVMFLNSGPVAIGHGTVVGGRYVITHNHYKYPLTDATGEANHATKISLARANDEFIMRNAPLSNFTVVAAAPGMLLLDFRTIGGEGFFDHLGIPSAPVASWNSFAIQPGGEVAQANWDGKTTFVEWVRVSSIRDAGSTPALEIENFIELGASGGGVFYGGYHIGNNWLQGMIYHTDTQEMARRYSVATTNDANVLTEQ